MDFLSMMAKRESCRKYDGRPASREDLIKIVEAGRLTPSGCNSQPWKFIIVDEEEALRGLRDALVMDNGDTSAAWRDKVSSFIICVETKATLMPMVMEHYHDSQRFALSDLGMAVMNMCYEAMELGLSTCILGMCNREKMESAFDIPKDCNPFLILAVGYPLEERAPREKVRKPFEEICSFNKWN